MSHETDRSAPHPDRSPDRDRREFLVKAGRFAAVTPPAIGMLLVTSMNSSAVASSGGGGGGGGGKVHGNNGWGNGGNDGTNPGSSHGNTSGSKSANILR
jgi:hypothetical protein